MSGGLPSLGLDGTDLTPAEKLRRRAALAAIGATDTEVEAMRAMGRDESTAILQGSDAQVAQHMQALRDAGFEAPENSAGLGGVGSKIAPIEYDSAYARRGYSDEAGISTLQRTQRKRTEIGQEAAADGLPAAQTVSPLDDVQKQQQLASLKRWRRSTGANDDFGIW